MCFQSTSSGAGCDSVIYNNSQWEYSPGRIIGYQFGGAHTFAHVYSSNYVDGISITHGQSPRQHIWTFAAGFSEYNSVISCPCGSPTHPATIPPYIIGSNYFCGTGYNTNSSNINSAILYFDDPLWDGEGCSSHRSCECTLHSPPWFTAQLNSSTADDIEVRICNIEETAKSNVGIELIELYVK